MTRPSVSFRLNFFPVIFFPEKVHQVFDGILNTLKTGKYDDSKIADVESSSSYAGKNRNALARFNIDAMDAQEPPDLDDTKTMKEFPYTAIDISAFLE